MHIGSACSSHDLLLLLPLVESDGEGDERGEHGILVTLVTIRSEQSKTHTHTHTQKKKKKKGKKIH